MSQYYPVLDKLIPLSMKIRYWVALEEFADYLAKNDTNIELEGYTLKLKAELFKFYLHENKCPIENGFKCKFKVNTNRVEQENYESRKGCYNCFYKYTKIVKIVKFSNKDCLTQIHYIKCIKNKYMEQFVYFSEWLQKCRLIMNSEIKKNIKNPLGGLLD